MLIEEAIVLNPDQQIALQELNTWWALPRTHPDYWNCILSAAAGCGKTFLTNHFTKSLKGVYPLYTATTNEAVRQMELAGVANARTTHSALGLRPVISMEKPYFIQENLPDDIGNFNLFLVDEASMAGKMEEDSSILLIIDYINQLGMRTLWLGDSYQLPPTEAKKGISPIFSLNYKEVTLTTVVRNSGTILELCTLLRSCIDAPVKRMPKIPKEVICLTMPKFYTYLQNDKVLQNFRAGTIRVIGWRNANIDIINNKIRENLYGKKLALAEPYLQTDQILFTAPLIVGTLPETPEKIQHCKNLRTGASINSRAEILSVSLVTIFEIECYLCRVRIEGGIEQIAYIPTILGTRLLAKLKNKISSDVIHLNARQVAAKWKLWHSFNGIFAKVKHSYAITTNRAQGATIPNVIVDTVDILANANRNTLETYKRLYTACSRASKTLILIRH